MGGEGGWGLGPKVRPPSEEALRREKTGFGVSPPSHQEGCCCRAGAQGRSVELLRHHWTAEDSSGTDAMLKAEADQDARASAFVLQCSSEMEGSRLVQDLAPCLEQT